MPKRKRHDGGPAALSVSVTGGIEGAQPASEWRKGKRRKDETDDERKTGAGGFSDTVAQQKAAANVSLFVNKPLYVERGVLDNDVLILPPVNGISARDNTLEFVIREEGGKYIDLGKVRLYLRMKLVKGDRSGEGDDLVEADDVAPVNNLPHSLHSRIEVKINNVIVPELGNDWPGLDSFLETMFNAPTNVAKRVLTNDGWHLDNARVPDATVTKKGTGEAQMIDPSETNLAYVERREKWSKSKEVEFYFSPNLPFLIPEMLMPDNASMSIRFIPARPEFYLMAGEGNAAAAPKNYRIRVLEAKLECTRLQLASEPLSANMHSGEANQYYYIPFNRTEYRIETVPRGTTHVDLPEVFKGRRASTCMALMADSDRFYGHIEKNPYHFPGTALKCAQYVDGSYNVPQDGFSWDFKTVAKGEKDESLYTREYLRMREWAGLGKSPTCLTSSFYRHSLLPVFVDLTPDLCVGVHRHSDKQRRLGFRATFDASEDTRLLIFRALFPERIRVHWSTGVPSMENALTVTDRATFLRAVFSR